MNQNQTQSKPENAEQPSGEGVVVQRLVRQVESLTEAVASLAACLQRGPCWGATGETTYVLSKAWKLVDKVRAENPTNNLKVLRAACPHEKVAEYAYVPHPSGEPSPPLRVCEYCGITIKAQAPKPAPQNHEYETKLQRWQG